MMTVQECINYVESHLEVRYATENGAYTCGRTINPKGSVNHSVGCAQPNVDVFYKLMNKESCGWGVNAILGDFHKGEGRILLTLKYNSRPWGCGAGSKGSWNNSKVQWEICEPAGHTYAGGTMIGYDVAKNQQFFDRMWKMVVAWNVYMVKKFGYPVSGISDHAESYKAGYGSNHSDVGQWWPKHGKSMDALRKEVQTILNGGGSAILDQGKTVNYQSKVIADDGLNCRDEPNGTILMAYPNGAILTITQEKNGWGFTGAGWVSLQWVEKISDNIMQEDDDMDLAKFKEFWNQMRKELQDNDSSAYSKAAREWATSTGLIAGNGTQINGEPNYMWADILTREQFVTVLYRFAQMMGKA
jgi:hypothetical protein